MEQKPRDRLAWIAAIILTPILIYLLATNVFKVGRRPPAQVPPPARAPAAAPAHPVPPPALPRSTLDAKPTAEQQALAARLPRRNPFSVVPEASAAPAAVSRPAPAAAPAGAGETAFKITAIMSRPGAKRMAMINGRLLGEGDRVGEWTILKVNERNVLVDNGSRQMVVGPR